MGFFSSKPSAPVKQASPQPAPKIVAPRSKPVPPAAPIAITGVGIACHAGEQLYTLISSVIGQMSGTELSDAHKVKSHDDGSKVMTRIAPVTGIDDIRAKIRMHTLTATALVNAEIELPGSVDIEKLLIVVMLAPELITYDGKLDTEPLKRHLLAETVNLDAATFRFLSHEAFSNSSVLRLSIDELNEGKWDAVIFGGADSLITMETCNKLNEQNRLSTVGRSEGLVPGEAAAFVVLQTRDLALRSSSTIKAYLKGLGVAAEPNARAADTQATAGLASAINQALAQAGIVASDIHGIIHNLGAETVHSFEWYQTTQALWPRRVSEQQRMAVQNGEIKQADLPDDPLPETILPYLTMGEVGAAVLPIQLATALSWIEYDVSQSRWGFPIRQHLLVCDTPYNPGTPGNAQRGALIVSPNLAT